MSKVNLIIGSHVSMKAPNFLLGCVQEATSYKANALMFYTGAPQNTIRKPVDQLKITQFHQELITQNIALENVIVHAPYIINLANSLKQHTFDYSVEFLQKEIIRCEEIGIKTIVLHPGSAVGAPLEKALEQLVQGLNLVCHPQQKVRIALETMAGKGSEIGINFEQLSYVIKNVKYPELIGVCWDTCHLFDAGYNIVQDLDHVIAQFDQAIGLDKLWVIHINDSKFGINSHKDRHANLGEGTIGLEAIIKIIHHSSLFGKTMILETPWVNGQPVYKEEIALIKKHLNL